MGLTSSQGRLLMLTSRISDVQFQEIMISQRQNQLATQSQQAATEYSEAMNNYKLEIKVTDNSSATGVSKESVNYSNLSAMKYLVTNDMGEIYLKKDEEGNWIIPKDIDGNPLLSIDEATGKAVVGGKEYEISDGTNYLSNQTTLQNLIMNGVLNVVSLENFKDGNTGDILEADTTIEWVLDTSDDAAALSKYEYEEANISRKDNKLDLEMDQLETQHNALMKEYDSVKDVINNNIERTFKLFSDS